VSLTRGRFVVLPVESCFPARSITAKIRATKALASPARSPLKGPAIVGSTILICPVALREKWRIVTSLDFMPARKHVPETFHVEITNVQRGATLRLAPSVSFCLMLSRRVPAVQSLSTLWVPKGSPALIPFQPAGQITFNACTAHAIFFIMIYF